MPPAPAAHLQRCRPRDGVRPARRASLVLWTSATLLLLGGTALAGGEVKPAPKFRAFENAWKLRAVDSIVGCMESEGTAVFQLLAYPLSGRARSMKPEQAKASLKAYFKKIASVKLEDVSPEKSPKNVRLYEYTYKPAGENTRTTHLRVQLKQDKNGLWVLASVNESAKPRE